MTTIHRKHTGTASEYLLEADIAPGTRTRVHGPLWDGVLNATPDDETDGPNPVEALMAAAVACMARNLRSVTDAAHVRFDRVAIRVGVERADQPPAITALRLEIAITTDVPDGQARRLVELALRDATITRTLARGLDLAVLLTINDGPLEALHVA
jgi:uncharacterized OsmC-like protein